MTVLPQRCRLCLMVSSFERDHGSKVAVNDEKLFFSHLEREPSEDLRVGFHQRQMDLFPVFHYLGPRKRKKKLGQVQAFIDGRKLLRKC